MEGRIIKSKIKNLTIHTYISSEEAFEVTSQIIETDRKLIIVDAQFYLKHAREVLDYARTLGKSIECIIISHSHPDHWIGLEVFKDYKIISSESISKEIEESGDALLNLVGQVHGDKVSKIKITPSGELTAGELVIDGIRLQIEELTMAECSNHVALKLPDYSVFIAQDIVYNEIHTFFGDNYHENWLKILKDYLNQQNYNLVYPGHGAPGGKELIEQTIEYIKVVKNFLIAGVEGEELKEKLKELFPEYKASHLIDISNDYLAYGEHKVE